MLSNIVKKCFAFAISIVNILNIRYKKLEDVSAIIRISGKCFICTNHGHTIAIIINSIHIYAEF